MAGLQANSSYACTPRAILLQAMSCYATGIGGGDTAVEPSGRAVCKEHIGSTKFNLETQAGPLRWRGISDPSAQLRVAAACSNDSAVATLTWFVISSQAISLELGAQSSCANAQVNLRTCCQSWVVLDFPWHSHGFRRMRYSYAELSAVLCLVCFLHRCHAILHLHDDCCMICPKIWYLGYCLAAPKCSVWLTQPQSHGTA